MGLKIKLQSVANFNATRLDVPAIERLLNITKVDVYYVALQNQFECLDSEVDLECMWENFKQIVPDVSVEVLGKRTRKVKEQHLSNSQTPILLPADQKTPNSTSWSRRAIRLTTTKLGD